MQDYLKAKLGPTKHEVLVILSWLQVYNNSLMMRHHLPRWIMKKFPKGIRWGEAVDTLDDAFFHCRFVVPLCRFIEDSMLRGMFFVLEACSVCSNVVSSLMNSLWSLAWWVFYEIHGIVHMSDQIQWRREFQLFLTKLVFSYQLKVNIRTQRSRHTP